MFIIFRLYFLTKTNNYNVKFKNEVGPINEKTSFFLGFCLLLTALVTVQGISSPGTSYYPEPVFQVENAKDTLFFTFNLLPGKPQLDVLLNILDEHSIKTVFFVPGTWLKKYPQEAKAIIERGHEIGNQTFTLSRLPTLEEDEIVQEISLFNNLCQEVCGVKPGFFRPPYGEYNPLIVRIARENDCFTLLWSINALLLSNLEIELILSHLEEQIHDGAVILFHASLPLVEVLPPIIAFLQWKGYTIASPDIILEYAEKKFPLPGR